MMTTEDRLLDLVRQWEDGRRRGRQLTAEALCKDYPELLEPLRRRMAALEVEHGTLRPSESQPNVSQTQVVARIRSLPRDQWVNAIREYQRRQWLEGRPVPAETLVELFPDLDAEETLVLIGGEYSIGRELGRQLDATEFQRRFPHFAEKLAVILALLDKSFAPGGASIGVAYEDSTKAVAAAATASVDKPLPIVEPQAGAEPIPGFRLVRLLGMGGFGSVWLAEAPGQFSVALKFVVLSGQVGASELRSLDILRHLRHANLLTTFGAWKNDRYLIVAMELADRTLADRYKEAKGQGLPGIPREELYEYMQAAAKAIDYLNEPHVLIEGQPPVRVQHRDIKPANILLVGSGVKVADFGLARVLEKNLVSHTGGLTPAYAAPEFFQGNTSRHSDQYSLAAAYCELRGGRLPFTGPLADLILGHVEKQPDLEMLPAEERPAVARALAKNPEVRWPSCKKFVDALGHGMRGARGSPIPRSDGNESWNGGAGDLASTAPFAEVAVQEKRHRGRIVGFLVLLAIAVGMVGWNWESIRGMLKPAPPQPQPEIARNDNPKVDPIDDVGNVKKIDEKKYPVEVKPVDKKPPMEEPKKIAEEPKKQIDEPKKIDVEPKKFTEEPKKIIEQPKKALPPKIAGGERLRIAQHAPAKVRCAALVPNTTRILSGDADGKLYLWDAAMGKEIMRLPAHTKAVQSLAVSADGRLALAGGDDMTLRLFDLQKPTNPKILRKKRQGVGDEDFDIYGVGFIDDGAKALAAGNANLMIAWNLETAEESERLLTGLDEVFCLGLSRDGKRAVIGGVKGDLRLRDTTPDSQEVRYEGHSDDVLSVAFFRDGERFVSAGGGNGPDKGNEDYVVRVWKMGVTNTSLELKGHRAKVNCVAVSPDDRRILSGDQAGAVRLWDSTSGREYARFDEPRKGEDDRSAVTCVLFAADGKEAISGHVDGSVRVWVLPEEP